MTYNFRYCRRSASETVTVSASAVSAVPRTPVRDVNREASRRRRWSWLCQCYVSQLTMLCSTTLHTTAGRLTSSPDWKLVSLQICQLSPAVGDFRRTCAKQRNVSGSAAQLSGVVRVHVIPVGPSQFQVRAARSPAVRRHLVKVRLTA